MRSLIFSLFMLLPTFGWAQELVKSDPTLDAVLLNRDGGEALKSQNFVQAYELFVKGLAQSPFQPEFHLNLGIAFEGRNEGEKAIQSYLSAEKLSNDPTLRFMAQFNAAQAYGKAKKIDEALKYYQMALELDPHSLEVKTNIELLIQAQGGGGGQGDKKNDKSDKGDQNQEQKQDEQNQDKDKDKDKEEKDKNKDKDYKDPREQKKDQQKQPNPEELSESDVEKIFNELKQQEQKIRAEYQKKEAKERPRDKDW
ncbi:MAG: tetratricopeptide repeat protein [Pseudobdellovibrionaceae bacterium]